MKNLFYFFVILTLAWSCKAQEELLKMQQIPDYPVFAGEFLDKELNLQAGVDNWREGLPQIFFPFKPDHYNFTGWDRVAYANIILGIEKDPAVPVLEQSMDLRFIVVLYPSIEGLSSYNTPSVVEQTFQKGQKKLWRTQKTIADLSKREGFVIRVKIQKSTKIEFYSTEVGDQPSNALEIVETKEFPPLHSSVTKRFLVKMRINCRLYKEDGTYVGNLKGVLVNHYDYFPIK